jgi:hypothetical protein
MAPGGLVPPEPKFGLERTGNGYWKKREVKTKRPLLAQMTTAGLCSLAFVRFSARLNSYTTPVPLRATGAVEAGRSLTQV